MTDKQAFAEDFSGVRRQSPALEAPAVARAHTGEIRPLAKADIPALAAIYHRVFLKPGSTLPLALAGYLERQFLPAETSDIGSLVYERGGVLAGFVGSIPLAYSIDGRDVRAAMLTSFMVDNHADDPMGGAKLLRVMVGGPQDITMSETASQTSVAMWRSLRGTVLPGYSLDWLKILSPAGYLTSQLGRRLGVARLALPLAGAVDRAIARRPAGPLHWRPFVAGEAKGIASRDIDLDEAASLVRDLITSYTARPIWADRGLEQRLAAASSKSRFGPMISRAVMARGSKPIGLFIYHARRGEMGHVLQVLARPGQAGIVLDAMFAHAVFNGVTALRGRADPQLLDAMLGRNCRFTNSATTVVNARDETLLKPMLAGQALMTGLAGETWSPLIGNDLR